MTEIYEDDECSCSGTERGNKINNEGIKLMNQNQLNDATEPRSVDQQQACSALICDMSGCHEHATGELLVGGDEWFPLCEKHRAEEFVRTAPKWRLLPPHKPNTKISDA